MFDNVLIEKTLTNIKNDLNKNKTLYRYKDKSVFIENQSIYLLNNNKIDQITAIDKALQKNIGNIFYSEGAKESVDFVNMLKLKDDIFDE